MSSVLTERDGHTFIVTLNRPHRMNAMTMTMFAKLDDAWHEAADDPDIRTIILTGAEGNFSSGMDLRSLAGDSDEEDALPEDVLADKLANDVDFIYRGLLKTYQPPKPVIAAVEGNAIAGGTEILQGTDIRVAGDTATFGVSEAKWSLYPAGGSAVRLRRQIPYTIAAEILLTGKHLTAQETKDIVGLIGHVVPAGEALTKAREIAEVINYNGPLAVEAILRTLRETETLSEEEAFAHEMTYGMAVMGSEDAKEGPRAFKEKRKPNFQRK
jgi:enoyl-CoA hydratase